MDDLEDKVSAETVSSIEKDELNEERNYRRRGNSSWVIALIFIFMGVVFLLEELNIPIFENLQNWWALFLLIPAIASFGSAWNSFQKHNNQFSSGVMGSLIAGFVLSLIAVIFLFNLEWSFMWPIIFIVIGVLMFISSFLKKD